MMDPVSVFDAKNRLSALLDQVERGSEVIITRRGKPVARLVPAVEIDRPRAVVGGLRALRRDIADRGIRLTWPELKSYRNEGRK